MRKRKRLRCKQPGSGTCDTVSGADAGCEEDSQKAALAICMSALSGSNILTEKNSLEPAWGRIGCGSEAGLLPRREPW